MSKYPSNNQSDEEFIAGFFSNASRQAPKGNLLGVFSGVLNAGLPEILEITTRAELVAALSGDHVIEDLCKGRSNAYEIVGKLEGITNDDDVAKILSAPGAIEALCLYPEARGRLRDQVIGKRPHIADHMTVKAIEAFNEHAHVTSEQRLTVRGVSTSSPGGLKR